MLKNERGSITVFTLTAVMFFVIILMGVFVTANNSKKAQKLADTTIIDKYAQEVDLVDEIYNEKKLQSSNSYNFNNVIIKWNTDDINYININSIKVKAQINLKDENIDLNNCKFIINNNRKYIGIDSEEWQLSSAIKITSLNGTIETNIKANEPYYIHVYIAKTDESKYEVISNTYKCEAYIVNYNVNDGDQNIDEQIKIAGKDLTLSSTVPTKMGYKFKGWGTSSSSTTVEYTAGQTYTKNSNLNLYAIWQEPIIVKEVATGLTNVTLSGSVAIPEVRSNKLSLSTSKEYMIEFDYYCLFETNKFDVDLYPDTLPQILPVATTTTQHYKWITKSAHENMTSCYLRFFDDQQAANESDIIISNIKLYEISW